MSSDQPNTLNLETKLYVLAVGLTAACGLVIEIVAGRMLAPYLGMSLYTWTAIIAVVLAGFSVGHWVGGRLADSHVRSAHTIVAWSLLVCALSTGAILILIRVLSGPVLGLNLGPVPTIVVLTSLLFFLPSFCVGIPSPILTKIAITEQPNRTGRVIGAMYAAGAFGSIIGTLAAGFVLISWLGSTMTILLVAGIYLALSFIFFFVIKEDAKRALLTPLACLVLSTIAFGGIGNKVQAFVPNCDVESGYYCIRVVDISRQIGEPTRMMILDHLGHGMNVRSSPSRFLSSYVDLTDRLVMLHMAGRTSLSAYFVGGGAYTLPRAWMARGDTIDITVAELDPMVTLVARRKLWLRPAPGLRVLHQDGRIGLRSRPNRRYDIVIGDAFHDIAVPQHLVTLEFFQLVKARLRHRGIYAMTVVDNAKRPRLMLSITKTLQKVFPAVEVWLDSDQAAAGDRATFIVLGGSRVTPLDVMTSQQETGRQWLKWSASDVARLKEKLGAIVLTDDFAPVDRMLSKL